MAMSRTTRCNVTFNDGTTIEIEKGTTVYELSKLYQPKMKTKIIGAELNNETVNFVTKINKSCNINFIDCNSINGYL